MARALTIRSHTQAGDVAEKEDVHHAASRVMGFGCGHAISRTLKWGDPRKCMQLVQLMHHVREIPLPGKAPSYAHNSQEWEPSSLLLRKRVIESDCCLFR